MTSTTTSTTSTNPTTPVFKTAACQLRASKNYYNNHKERRLTRIHAYYQENKEEIKRKKRLQYAQKKAAQRAAAERAAESSETPISAS